MHRFLPRVTMQVLPQSRQTRTFHASGLRLKDKSDSRGGTGPRESRFGGGEQVKKEKTDEDKKKRAAERAEREKRKSETRKAQLYKEKTKKKAKEVKATVSSNSQIKSKKIDQWKDGLVHD
eukprot:gb/GEZN01028437.1/.p1 GENE.gb/GEZN01028437.1/~~gb/GEZN01028437.1/.p1  ORF type:complete len:121 (+),score=26.07 gb/GEZN01028437.1/:55-417(+)